MAAILAYGALVVFFGASFFFALAESSLFSLGKWQLHHLEKESPKHGKLVRQLLVEPQDLLATIVLGNSFANASLVGISLWIVLSNDYPIAGIMAGLCLAILMGAEVAPKALAVRSPERWALRVAPVMSMLQRITRPLRKVAQSIVKLVLRQKTSTVVTAPTGLSDAEYQELLEMACQQGALAAGEKEIILQIISLDRRQAKDVMKPRSQMACISDDLSIEEMVASARRFKHRRLPIFDETPDTIVGVLNTRALLLDPDQDLANAIEFPSFVPASMNLLQLLKSLQRQQRGLAIVLDEFGGTAGIVTIEDILAEVVGEFRRESSSHAFIMERVGNGRWRVSGNLRLDDFRREYPALGDVPGVETVGGLVLHKFEVVPAEGESVVFRGLRFTVKVADERRIQELLVRVVKNK